MLGAAPQSMCPLGAKFLQLCATLSIIAMGFMPSILVIRAHSYQLPHEITHQYDSEGVNDAAITNATANTTITTTVTIKACFSA